MLDILLIVHVIVSVLLIGAILLQKTSVDGASTLSGSNAGLFGVNAAYTFLMRLTIILAVVFAINSLLIANYFSNLSKKINEDLDPQRIDMVR